jgi:hypothetical protein
VANATIATQIHQSLDVHRYLAAKIALDLVFADFRPKPIDLVFGKRLNPRILCHTGRGADLSRAATANTVDSRQGDDRMLAIGDVYTGDTRHSGTSLQNSLNAIDKRLNRSGSLGESTLALFVSWIFADDTNGSPTPNQLTVPADCFY